MTIVSSMAFRKISINSSKGHSTLTYRKFNNFDSASFRYDILTQDWDRVNNYDDPNVTDMSRFDPN